MNCLSFTGKPLLSWIPSSKVIKKVVIFLHGSGDSGSGVSSWLESLGAKTEFDRLDIGVVFPSAQLRPYTMYAGDLSTVWHDRKELNIHAWEDVEGIAAMSGNIQKLITDITSQLNIPVNKIALGGFSQGGHQSLHAAYSNNVGPVGAVFALGSFLCQESVVYTKLKSSSSHPPLFLSHGSEDSLVWPEWVGTTRDKLSGLNVDVNYSIVHGIGHEMESQQLKDLVLWINELH